MVAKNLVPRYLFGVSDGSARGTVGTVPRVASLLSALLLTGCYILPIGTYKNEELRQENAVSSEGKRNRVGALETTDWWDAQQQDRPFVGIAISGGGSRSAVFGAAVLEELDKLGILDKTAAISGVSGGALPATYYTLNRWKSGWQWAKFHDRMAVNFLSRWIAKVLNPLNLLRSAFSDFDRSDLMARVFDETLFDGKTFRALEQAKVRLLINATNVTNGGSRFVFDNTEFDNHRSDLAAYPLAHAVMASGAFPGVFNNVTLRNFEERTCDESSAQPCYTHLMDGGPSDNLGIETLIDAAQTFYRFYDGAKDRPRSCLIISVDASPDPLKGTAALKFKRDTRHWFDFLIDTNVINATDAMLRARRRSSLSAYGVFHEDVFQNPVTSFPLYHFSRVNSPFFADDPKRECKFWHISFDNLSNHLPVFARKIRSERYQQQLTTIYALTSLYETMYGVVSSVETNYTLSSPQGCSSSILRDSLTNAARILVRNDATSLGEIYRWFKEQGIELSQLPRPLVPTAVIPDAEAKGGCPKTLGDTSLVEGDWIHSPDQPTQLAPTRSPNPAQ